MSNPPTRLSAEAIAAIRERAEKATRGPWKVYKTRYTLTELGRQQGFKEDRKSVVNAIGTEWDHPQLKGPDAIVTTTHGPFYEPQHAVSIDDNDAEFIAHARTDIPALLAHISVLEAELQEWRGFHNRLVDDIRDLANLITGGYANGKTQDEMLGYLRSGITRMSAELQEAREQRDRWKSRADQIAIAHRDYRSQLIAAVQALPMSGFLHNGEMVEVADFIESFEGKQS